MMAGNMSWQDLALVIATLFAIVLNNVGGSMMAFVMPAYPAYLLYGTTLLYTIVFLLIAIVQDGSLALSWGQHRHIFWLTLWTVLNGLLFQYSDPWVSGPIAQVLPNLSIPSVWFFNKFLLHDQSTIRENIGIGIVFCGVFVGIIPAFFKQDDDHAGGTQSNPWLAVVGFGLSAVVQGLEMTFQDRAMRAENAVKPATALFWYNLYSLFAYMVTFVGEGFENQVHAVRCAVGDPFPGDTLSSGGNEPNCRPMSWFWPQVFVLGYVGMFYFNALLMKRFNALWVGVINTLGGPIAAVVFTVPTIVGQDNVVATNWSCIIVSFVIILGGVLIKGTPQESSAAEKPKQLRDVRFLEADVESTQS